MSRGLTKRTTMLVMGTVAAIGVSWLALSHAGQPRLDSEMRTAPVSRGDVSVIVSATGTVTATSQVDVRSRATGTVTRVYVQEGDHVAQGQLLAMIDDPDARAALRKARAQVAQARANVALAQAKLDQAKQNVPLTADQSTASIAQARAAVENAKARLQTVRSGSRPEQIAQAREAVRQAQANLDLAKANLGRQEQLFNEGAVAHASLDQAQNQYQVALAQLRAARQQLQLEEAGPLQSDIATAEAEVRQAEAQLANANAGAQTVQLRRSDVTAAEAEVGQAQAQLANALAQLQNAQERDDEGFVRAPISGIVAKRSVEIGQTVIGGTATSGTSVFMLADIAPLLADVSVDETDIAQVRLGMPVKITADALHDTPFAGVVERIAPAGVVSQSVNQYKVTVEITNPVPALRLGMTVNADFVVAAARNVLLVPNEALSGQEPKVVLIVGGHTHLIRRPVVTGITDGRVTEIRRGVREGERVYLGPARSLSPQRNPQSRNPFQPNFQRLRPSGGGQ